MGQSRFSNIGSAIMTSLPIQLLVIQVRNQKFVLLLWLVLIGVVSGWIAESLGGAFLLLEPEYLGEEGFWSTFIVGCALGGFIFAYMITLYIAESYRFNFIALTEHPFYVFAYNNLFLPGTFLFIYFYRFIEFHVSTQGHFNWEVAERVLGLGLGISMIFLLSVSYFFTNRTLIHYFSHRLQKDIKLGEGKHNRKVILEKAKKSYRMRPHAESFLKFPWKVVRVENLPPIEFRDIVKTLSQHHSKLLLLQIGVFLLIAILGLLEGQPRYQFPAGATMLLVFSLMLMIAGAISFWYRRLGLLVLVLFVGFLLFYTKYDFLHEKSFAFGLDYTPKPTEYHHDTANLLCNEETYRADKQVHTQILNNWKQQQARRGGKAPHAVFVSSSGGGLRSSFWTMRVLQHLDSLTQGELSQEIRLMAGASGGMVGQAYFREIYWRSLKGELSPVHDPCYRENLSKDLLNRIFFKSLTDVLLPNRRFRIRENVYDRETGFSFDQQLMRNMPEFAGRTLGDYQAPELSGTIPLLLLTPTILNRGRKLYISPTPVSFFSRPSPISPHYATRSSGIEFRRMFANHQPDSLWFATALRMNATFPYILPMVQLPTEPTMEVIDAGAVDNYGVEPTIRYLYEFKNWFARHTQGVIFILIRDNVRDDPIKDIAGKGFLNRMLAPVGSGYDSVTEARDMFSEHLMSFVREWYDGPIHVFSFEYPRETSDAPASLSWHLTEREKESILRSIYTQHNQEGFQAIQELYHHSLIAEKP